MTKDQAVNLLLSLIKQTKLTEDERLLCYQALKFLSELDGKAVIQVQDQAPQSKAQQLPYQKKTI